MPQKAINGQELVITSLFTPSLTTRPWLQTSQMKKYDYSTPERVEMYFDGASMSLIGERKENSWDNMVKTGLYSFLQTMHLSHIPSP